MNFKNNRSILQVKKPKISLANCIKLNLPASKLLEKIYDLSVQIASVEILNSKQKELSLDVELEEYLEEYLNTWYYFNNLKLETLEEKITGNYFGPNKEAYSKIKSELTQSLILICKELKIQTCFEMVESFEKQIDSKLDLLHYNN